MQHTIKDFQLTLIDEPDQTQVVAWEQAARQLKNEDAKPLLSRVLASLDEIRVTDSNLKSLIGVFTVVSEALKEAMKILEDNETLTLSSNRGVMVKAAIMAKWIVSPELKPEDVDHMKPWLVHWIAEKVASLYMEVTTIPKN